MMQLLYDNQQTLVKFGNRGEIIQSSCSIRITIVESKDFHTFYVIQCNVGYKLNGYYDQIWYEPIGDFHYK